MEPSAIEYNATAAEVNDTPSTCVDHHNDVDHHDQMSTSEPALSPKATPFSVTDILSPLEELSYRRSLEASNYITASSSMGPPSPVSPGGSASSTAAAAAAAGFISYSNYGRTTSGGGMSSVTTGTTPTGMSGSYSHMNMSHLNAHAGSFPTSGYCQTGAASDLHYPGSASTSGWYSSPATDPRFASEYCK